MENGKQPINPMPHVNQDGTIQHDVYFGLTKREYFAGKYAGASDEFFKEASQKLIMAFLGIDESIDYNPIVHYPQAVIKMQLIFADELLKQLENER